MKSPAPNLNLLQDSSILVQDVCKKYPTLHLMFLPYLAASLVLKVSLSPALTWKASSVFSGPVGQVKLEPEVTTSYLT